MDKYIHVKIGTIDGVYPVQALYTTGVFKDIYEYRKDANTIAWVHKRWCTPYKSDGTLVCQDATPIADTDWRKFLKEHWDEERGHLRTDCLNQFMVMFINAAAAHMKKKQKSYLSETIAKKAKQLQKSKPHYIQLSLFD